MFANSYSQSYPWTFHERRSFQLCETLLAKIDQMSLEITQLTAIVNNQAIVTSCWDNIMEAIQTDEANIDPLVQPQAEQPLCCRICLIQDCELISLETYSLRTAYTELTGVAVDYNDGLPRELCVECATLLGKYHKFRNKSLTGDQLLRQICSNQGGLTKNSVYQVDRGAYGLQSNLNIKRNPGWENAGTGGLLLQEHITAPNTDFSVIDNSVLDYGVMDNCVMDNSVLDYSVMDNSVMDNSFMDNSCMDNSFIDNGIPETNIMEENQFEYNTQKNDVVQNKPKPITFQYPDQNDNDNSDNSHGVSLNTKIPKKLKKTKTKKKPKKPKKDKPVCTKDKLSQNNYLLDECFKVIELSLEERLQNHEEKKYQDNYCCNEFKCEFCYKGYQNETSLKTHMTLHREDKGEYCCDICKKRFRTRFKMMGHYKITHLFRFECLKCSQQFFRRYAAINHARWHGGNNYHCEQCGATYQKQTSLLTHMRIKHPSNNACSYCGLSYLGEKGLDAHIHLRHKDDVQQVITGPWCLECGIQFISPEVLQIHNDVKHTTISSNKRNETKYPNAVLNTSLKQRKKKDFPCPCEACGEMMGDGREYYHHFRNKHPDMTRAHVTDKRKQHMCDKCSRQFANKTHLREHLLEHGDETPYKCDKCPKSYKNTLKLKAHLKTHNEPKFECPLCKKLFSNKYNKDKHYKYVHPNADLEKTKCEICLKEFQSKWTLHFHNKHVHQNIPWPKRTRNKNRADM